MSQVINTNSLSLVAQNNLNKSQSALGTSIQRLSSGLRINSAKDDAAGQAISNRFTANITGLTQASRNANDGISIAQTTEGALNEVNDNLQNIRRLSVQAQNGTNSESDRKSIQDEINARLDEINRISEQTEFNGVKVLSKDQTLSIQVGSNDGQTIDINLSQMNSDTLGMAGFDISKMATKVGEGTSVTVGGNTTVLADTDVEAMKEAAFTVTGGGSGEVYAMNDGNGNTTYIAIGVDDNGDEVVSTMTPTITGPGVAPTWTATAVAPADIDAAKSAVNPLSAVDDAMAQVDEMRSGLGATQNRFDSVISNLNSTVNNLSESRSRILDADFASEVSEMSRANILQSAGISVLAQANQVPQNVLSLLR